VQSRIGSQLAVPNTNADKIKIDNVGNVPGSQIPDNNLLTADAMQLDNVKDGEGKSDKLPHKASKKKHKKKSKKAHKEK